MFNQLVDQKEINPQLFLEKSNNHFSLVWSKNVKHLLFSAP